MNNRFTHNFSYAFISNVINMMVSILPTLVLPRLFGDDIESYGYYQVYAFYITYVGMAHFGSIDGIYLKEGGKSYKDLDYPLYSSQFRILAVLEFLVGIGIGIFGILFFRKEYIFITWMVAANVILLCMQTYFTYIFQITYCIKEYVIIIIHGRIFYGLSFLFLIAFRVKNYETYVIFDVVAKCISLGIAFGYGKDIIRAVPVSFKCGLSEFCDNIRVGSQLMFASVSGMLVTGIVRWGIQRQWGIATYGKISLSLSICNIVSVLMNAAAMALYPELKRKKKSELRGIYQKLQNIIMLPMMAILVFYYPFKILLSVWVPNYSDSLNYLAILFPVSILTVKMAVIIQTYMKVMRMEKDILTTNISSLIFAIFSMFITVFVIRNLDLAMISIVANSIFRNIISETVLKRYLGIENFLDIALETLLIILFVVFSWIIGGAVSVLLYGGVYVMYLILKRVEVINIFNSMKKP